MLGSLDMAGIVWAQELLFTYVIYCLMKSSLIISQDLEFLLFDHGGL